MDGGVAVRIAGTTGARWRVAPYELLAEGRRSMRSWLDFGGIIYEPN